MNFPDLFRKEEKKCKKREWERSMNDAARANVHTGAG